MNLRDLRTLLSHLSSDDDERDSEVLVLFQAGSDLRVGERSDVDGVEFVDAGSHRSRGIEREIVLLKGF